MGELLLEIGCEELPGGACREAVEQAPRLMAEALEAARVPAGEVSVWVSPRRIGLSAADVAEERPGRTRSARGPAEQAAFDGGEPTKAALGFARGQGVEVGELIVREQDGRSFVFADVEEPPTATAELVPEIARHVLEGLRFGAAMRWGAGTGLRFSRPVRWIVAKHGDRTIPFELHGLTAGGTTRGHRTLGGPAEIDRAAAYRDALRDVSVVVDHEERRVSILRDLDAAAAAVGGRWTDPGGALEEVVFLVEWPSVLSGRFDESHLRLPEKVLVTAMQSHQRYFPLRDGDGRLMPRFLAVGNGDPAYAELITRGNEDVLDARLQDAAFSFDVDRTAGMEALDARLPDIVFHQRLGSMADKRDRLMEGARALAGLAGLSDHDAAAAAEAGRLAKVDQGAVLVAEFSELEGYVAAQYAAVEGHPEVVCEAVEDHYLPLGPGSPLPRGDVGAAVAAADKVDNLVGAFLADEAPTGSKDPYALRRAAAGLVRILIEREWDVPVSELLQGAADRLRAQGADLVLDDQEGLDQVREFLADRVEHALAGEGVAAEAAAAAQGAGLDSVTATAAWARGIQAAGGDPAFAAAWTGCTRLARLAEREGGEPGPFVSAGDEGEDALDAAVATAEDAIRSARERRDVAAALAAAEGLAAPVDRFFDDVLVNADDPDVRARRYALVARAARVLRGACDFTRITEGGGVL